MGKKEKKKKSEEKYTCFEIILIAAIFGIIVWVVLLFLSAYDKDDSSGTLNNLVSTLTCIMASLSVVFTIVSLRQTNANRYKDRKIEILSRWYSELIIDKYLPKIIAFFDECESLISPLMEISKDRGNLTGDQYDEKVKTKVIGPFTQQYTVLHKKLISDLNIMDSGLSSQVSNAFQQLQDGFSAFLIRTDINPDELQTFLKSKYGEIISDLMKYEKNDYTL